MSERMTNAVTIAAKTTCSRGQVCPTSREGPAIMGAIVANGRDRRARMQTYHVTVEDGQFVVEYDD